MTKDEAWKRAITLWGIGPGRGVNGGRRVPIVRLRIKRVIDRYEVGYHDDGAVEVVMGAGPSWEIAFERALKP